MVMNYYLAVILVRGNIGIYNACWYFRISSLLFGRPGSGHRDENNLDFSCFLHDLLNFTQVGLWMKSLLDGKCLK